MRLSDLLRHLSPISVSGPVDRPVRRVVHDSRDAGPGDVFVAIRGGKVDGRRFAPTLDVAAVIADGPVEVRAGVTAVQVSDARGALALAAAACEGSPGAAVPVIGVTGTNGKTTVTWMVEAIAAAVGWRAGVVGTTGWRIDGQGEPSPLTTPEAPALQRLLARMRDEGCDVVAMEVSSIGLSQRRVDGIPYQVAVFTSFSQDHLDFHGDMASYLAAKARLFTDLLAEGGTAVLNGDDAATARVPTRGRRWTYGTGEGADIRATVRSRGLDGTRAHVRTPLGEGELHLRLLGDHNLSNALAALGAALALGALLDAALRGLGALEAVPGRLERVPGPPGVAVFVDYAHTPDALTRVLAALRPLVTGEVVTVFGCGGDRDRAKRPAMGRAASEGSDRVVVTSDNPRSEDPASILADILPGVVGPAVVEPDRGAAIALAVRTARPGDLVLIAGKGHETYQITGDEARPFDDRAVAAAALAGGAA